jgi:hypothetical protein
MENKLPEFEINGIGFHVDVDNSRLIERSNPKNCWYISEMFDHGTGYTVHYNILSKKLDMRDPNIEGSCTSYIPYLTQMDPIGMSRKYGVALSVIQQPFKRDLDTMLESPELIERIKRGKQPELMIGKNTFFVNTHMGKLEMNGDLLGGITFYQLEYYSINNGTAYRIAFDTLTKQLVDIDLKNTEFISKEIMIVEFPHEQILDPVGYARDHRLDLRIMLMKHGFIPKREATIIPFSMKRMNVQKNNNSKGRSLKRKF